MVDEGSFVTAGPRRVLARGYHVTARFTLGFIKKSVRTGSAIESSILYLGCHKSGMRFYSIV